MILKIFILFFFHSLSDENTTQSKAFCSSTISYLKTLIEHEQVGKTKIDQSIESHKDIFTNTFAEHVNTNRGVLTKINDIKSVFDQQLEGLHKRLMDKFETFSQDCTQLMTMVSFHSDYVEN